MPLLGNLRGFILKIGNKIKKSPHKYIQSQTYFDTNKSAIDSERSAVN